MKILPSLLIVLMIVLSASLLAAAEITNFRTYHSGNRIVVEYDLSSDVPVMVDFAVTVQGRIYTHEHLSLEGDVGGQLIHGKGRKFYWDVYKDFPDGLNIEWKMLTRKE